MSTHMSLTEEQVTRFKEDGYLVVPDVVDEQTLENWRGQLWRRLDATLGDPDSWPRDAVALDGFEWDPQSTTLNQTPTMRAIAEQLGGGHFLGGGGSPIVRWPRDGEWQMPGGGHIDAYGPGGWSPFMFGVTTYLYDVEPGGGAFIYWPRSHRTTHAYFLEHPEEIDGTFEHQRLCEIAPEPPREFIAPAGSVVLWHAFLCHTGSDNIRSVPRFALFGRYRHDRRDEIRYEVPEDLWKYWAV